MNPALRVMSASRQDLQRVYIPQTSNCQYLMNSRCQAHIAHSGRPEHSFATVAGGVWSVLCDFWDSDCLAARKHLGLRCQKCGVLLFAFASVRCSRSHTHHGAAPINCSESLDDHPASGHKPAPLARPTLILSHAAPASAGDALSIVVNQSTSRDGCFFINQFSLMAGMLLRVHASHRRRQPINQRTASSSK